MANTDVCKLVVRVDQEAVQDRDATAGEQLHQPPGERPAPGRGAPRRTAVPRAVPAVLPRQLLPQPRIRPIGSAQAHLYFLPQQPEENGEQKMTLNCIKIYIFKLKKKKKTLFPLPQL